MFGILIILFRSRVINKNVENLVSTSVEKPDLF